MKPQQFLPNDTIIEIFRDADGNLYGEDLEKKVS
jgi:hypothetical protein